LHKNNLSIVFKSMKKTVLFISHDASRTGAPIIFLNFLRWFKGKTDIPFKILLRNGGPLESDFASLAPTMIFNPDYPTLTQRIMQRFGLWYPEKQFHPFLSNDDIGLIYSNTITNHAVLSQLSLFLQCPVISHVHELDYWIYRTGIENFEITRALTSHFIAVSNAVKENLIAHHNIDEACISTVYAFVITATPDHEQALKRQHEIRHQLNIPLDAFIVGASGTLDWRKGADLFIQLAHTIRRKNLEAPIYFLWLGGDENQEHHRFYELRHDLKKLNLDRTTIFLGNQPNPLDYFAVFDVFALMSREDPYPLVCLEAASLEKPILCFDLAGGEQEFVEGDCGFIVPYLDIETMAAKVYLLFESPELRTAIGQRAAEKVKEKHDIKSSASQILEIIQRFLYPTATAHI
jgi:glycosyltransferase involved in cell wall biosynthesis